MKRTQERHSVERARQLSVSSQSITLSTMYDLTDNDNAIYNYEGYARFGFGAQGDIGNTVVFAAIDRRASVFSEAAFKWRNLGTKRIWGNPDLHKLEVPWPNAVTGDLLTRMEQDVSLAGNSFTRDCGNRLERLRPDWVFIISKIRLDDFGQEVREVIGYWYNPIGDTEREPAFYPVEEVAHWAPIPDPLASFRGMSWLTPVIREINADTQMSAFRDAYFKNAASPNTVIKYSQKISPERIKKLKTQILERHSGPENAFSTMVLDEGADLTVIGNSMESASFDALQAAGEARILMAAGVPAIIAGAREGIRNTKIGEYSESLRGFADMKIRPNWRGACASLAKLVIVPAGNELWFDVTDVSALQEAELDKANAMVQYSTAANTFFMAGFEPESIVSALMANDLSLLSHTGLTSVQAQGAASKSDLVATEAISSVAQADLLPAGAPQPALPAGPAKKAAPAKAVNGKKPALAAKG
jgi:phage portal protein BeeE